MRVAKLAAVGAVAVSLGVLAVYAALVFLIRPSRTGGIDQTSTVVVWISLAIPVLLIVAVHLVFAKVLFDAANQRR